SKTIVQILFGACCARAHTSSKDCDAQDSAEAGYSEFKAARRMGGTMDRMAGESSVSQSKKLLASRLSDAAHPEMIRARRKYARQTNRKPGGGTMRNPIRSTQAIGPRTIPDASRVAKQNEPETTHLNRMKACRDHQFPDNRRSLLPRTLRVACKDPIHRPSAARQRRPRLPPASHAHWRCGEELHRPVCGPRDARSVLRC